MDKLLNVVKPIANMHAIQAMERY